MNDSMDNLRAVDEYTISLRAINDFKINIRASNDYKRSAGIRVQRLHLLMRLSRYCAGGKPSKAAAGCAAGRPFAVARPGTLPQSVAAVAVGGGSMSPFGCASSGFPATLGPAPPAPGMLLGMGTGEAFGSKPASMGLGCAREKLSSAGESAGVSITVPAGPPLAPVHAEGAGRPSTGPVGGVTSALNEKIDGGAGGPVPQPPAGTGTC